jgi:hypothetical protein
MATQAKKITDLQGLTSVSGDDLLMVVDSPNTSPSNKKVTVSNFFANVSTPVGLKHAVTVSNTATIDTLTISTKVSVANLNNIPASASANGTTGEVRFGNTYVYVCVSTNTWKRALLETW